MSALNLAAFLKVFSTFRNKILAIKSNLLINSIIYYIIIYLFYYYIIIYLLI